MTGARDPRSGWVLHVDLDQFIAAVEVLRRPELAGRPVVVGGRGDPTERGVVSTASYEARAHGVGSGMPLRVAARKCPEAVFLPVDKPAYDAASAEVMATLRAVTWDGAPVVVEVLGWDEAFLAVDPAAVSDTDRGVEGVGGGTPTSTGPEELAQQVRAAVLEATGLHCSVGIGDNKLRAKIATDLGKPRGTFRLTEETWFEVMGDRPTDALWGVGRRTAKKLAELGIETVAELAAADAGALAAELGPTMGPWYRRLGRGVDTSPVDPTPYVPRGHGREETFQADLEDWAEVEAAVRRLARAASADIAAEGRPAARVGLKVRYRPFTTVTRSFTLPAPTADPAALADAAAGLLDRVERDRPVRLLGVRLEMVPPADGS
ncbi:DNA polymerase IV [Nocardioides sp. zg-579]|uniref:DNA polymerase IV n=1 Tax=Nocardioides marmotae TaxID=2663857 RepID=A0A6I3IU95_9ACTN|nr:DNA polymerase IV [Nocardioides marmotae]MCR6030408.1 DNA polymerase IV [Gordonia jinghuaiqii]MTB94043.1 DNA polymerase IV [Nocardioides marmotae]QKE00351.1 DNA polymerase IV [Nocardioides marmotae]